MEKEDKIKLEKKYIFLLSGDHTDLAKEELVAIATKPKHLVDENVMIAETTINYKRLALTRNVYEFLFSCPIKDLEKNMKEFDWSSIYRESFCLRLKRSNRTVKLLKLDESDLAKNIWDAVKKPKVDLKYPMTKIHILLTNKNAYCGLLKHKLSKTFSERKSHLRPFNQPTSLDPKIARACVNLSGMKSGNVLVDPFCGAGGILLEAGLMRFSTKGYDIDSAVLEKCKKNLEHYKVKRFKLEQKNAIELSEKIDYVVTDLPYGQSSKISETNHDLYLKFLNNLYPLLENNAVVIFPNKVDHKKLIAKTKFKIDKEFSIYVHKSLTRHIVLLKK